MDSWSLDDPGAALFPSSSPTLVTTSLGSVLPNEILDAIFEHLSRDALTRVALVSHRWRANADRLLYASIVIHEVLPRFSPSHWSPPHCWPAHAHAPAFVAPPSSWPWHAAAVGLPMRSNRDSDVQHQQQQQMPRAMVIPAVPVATLRCCETLSARPHLAEYVRRFHVRWETDAVQSPFFLLPIAHNIARTLVPALVHLDSLELSFGLAPHLPFHIAPPLPSQHAYTSTQHYHPHPHPHPHHLHPHHHLHHQHLLPPFRLPCLRTLALHGIGEPSSHELERILRQHPSLLHLRLSDYHRPLSLAPADVPHLRSFRGYPATAASILPGRPVQALGLVGCGSASEEVLASIASGSTPVRSLDLSGMSVTPTLLRSVSRHLSHVEWLKVRLALRHTLHFALSGIRLLTALTTVFASFYNLRGLDLSPTSAVHQHTVNGTTTTVATTATTTTTSPATSTAYSASSASSDGENALEEQRLCVAWMGACPSLRRVVFPSRTEWWLSDAGTWISGSGSGSGSGPPPSSAAAPDPPRCYLSTPPRPR